MHHRPLFLALLVFPFLASAAIISRPVEYTADGTTFQGTLVYNDALKGPLPAVLVFHQWKGQGVYENRRAAMLAELGYVALAADVYGKGVRPADAKEAGALAGKYKSDRATLRSRAGAALRFLTSQSIVDPERVAAIGYCFGGTTALELARDGARVSGIVSFHGGLGSPAPADATNIRCKVLALHGADDPFVPPSEVQAFQSEMTKAKVDWQLISYGGAVHSFTHWDAGTDASTGAAYHAPSDRRSWVAMQDFLKEIFER